MKKIRRLLASLSLFDKIAFLAIATFGLLFLTLFYRKVEYTTIRIKITDEDVLVIRNNPQAWYANQFQVGDSEFDALGRNTAKIINIESFNIDSKKKALYMDIRMKAVFDPRTKQYSAKGKTLIFGTPIRFNFIRSTANGIITESPQADKSITIGTSRVFVLARNIEPAVAESIHIGDRIQNSRGALLAEVIEVTTTPAQKVTQTDTGQLLLANDPLYKDLVLQVAVRTKTFRNETFVFDNMPLKIGDILPLNFNTVSLTPIITSFTM